MDKGIQASSLPLEDIIGEELEDIVTLLCSTGTQKSRLYEDILSMVERGMIKIALKRSGNVKITTADFLGINRNTLHKKIDKLGIDCRKIRK